METPTQIDLKEFIGLIPSEIRVEANIYRTRGVYSLAVHGQKEEWHSVKGGQNIEKLLDHPDRAANINYEVFFNPKTKEWLKVVPPEALNPDRLTRRLELACDMGQAALEVAGLSYLKSTFEMTDVDLRGSKIRAFLSMHLGPSLQYLLRQVTDDPKRLSVPGIHRELISRVYMIAFDQAKELYLRYGYWTKDPNPGNVILHPTGDSYRVVLIDFTSNHQLSQNNFDYIPDEMGKQKEMSKRLRQLRAIFQHEIDLYGLNSRDWQE